jgi:hypothetical protein
VVPGELGATKAAAGMTPVTWPQAEEGASLHIMNLRFSSVSDIVLDHACN